MTTSSIKLEKNWLDVIGGEFDQPYMTKLKQFLQQEKAAGRIIIMPGSGVSEKNVADLVEFTGATEVHASARVRVQSKMDFKNDHIVMGNNYGDEYANEVTDIDRVRNILKIANE